MQGSLIFRRTLVLLETASSPWQAWKGRKARVPAGRLNM